MQVPQAKEHPPTAAAAAAHTESILTSLLFGTSKSNFDYRSSIIISIIATAATGNKSSATGASVIHYQEHLRNDTSPSACKNNGVVVL